MRSVPIGALLGAAVLIGAGGSGFATEAGTTVGPAGIEGDRLAWSGLFHGGNAVVGGQLPLPHSTVTPGFVRDEPGRNPAMGFGAPRGAHPRGWAAPPRSGSDRSERHALSPDQARRPASQDGSDPRAATPRGGAGGQPDLGATPESSDKLFDPGHGSIAALFGDAGPERWRSRFEKRGFTSSLTYIGESLGNVSGGVRRGLIAEGRFEIQVELDLGKMAGWSGAALHASAFQIHGEGLSRPYLGNNLLVVSGIEALPSTRLFEAWFEQKLLDGKLSVRVGQQGGDAEFMVSQFAALFVNATFGWPGFTAANLPSSGPPYPLATPAVRVKLAPHDQVTLLAALFNGDPAGPTPGPFEPFVDPQRRNRTGTNFRVDDPPLALAEAAYAYNRPGSAGLPGIVKVGVFHHLDRFNDQRFDAAGLWLADPASTGFPRRLRGNSGVYLVLDQKLYQPPGTTDQGMGFFTRLYRSPSDRNLLAWYGEAGLTYKGLLPGRPYDTVGLSGAYAHVSGPARQSDRDAAWTAGVPQPIRHSEALIELTYQARVVSGWTIQPDFQYVFRPGGNVTSFRHPERGALRNAAIFGLRTTVTY